MKHGPRLDVWVVGFLVGASLAAGAYFAVRFNLGGILNSPLRVSTEPPPSPPVPDSPTTLRHKKKSSRANSLHSKEVHLRESETVETELVALEKSDSGIPTVPATFSSLASAATGPELKILKPLGYVQKAGGAVEAIVSDGDGVQVVHVGDAFQEKYTVAQIAPDGVEVVTASARPSGSIPGTTVVSTANLVNGTGSEAWSYSPSLANTTRDQQQNQIASVSGKPGRVVGKGRTIAAVEPATSSRPGENLQLALARPINDSPKPLGYVEKADGTSLAVVSEGDSVRLMQPGNSPATQAIPKSDAAGVTTAQLSDLTGPKKGVRGQNPPAMQAGPSAHNPSPGVASTVVRASGMAGGTDRASRTSTALGFVEWAHGKLEAIVDDGNGIRLSKVSEPPSLILLASEESTRPANAAELLPEPMARPINPVSGLGVGIVSAHWLPGSPQTAGDSSAPTEDTSQAKESSKEGPPQSRGSPRNPPPEAEVTVADDRVIPERSPPDVATVEASMGLVTEAKGSSDREAAILESLGYANPQGGRASPKPPPFEPAAPPTGPPDFDAAVLRSFGYEEWQYGRGSPFAAWLGLKTTASDSGNPTFLKPLGYLEWQDGRAYAVLSGGDGGVCLVAEGETLDGRFRVVKVGSDAVAIVELPAKRISLTPGLRSSLEDELRPDSVEARPAATSIAELPLARSSSALALAATLLAQPAQATGARQGKKAVRRRARRTVLRTPPTAEVLQLLAPSEGKVRPQRKGPQPAPSTLAPPKARAHSPAGRRLQPDPLPSSPGFALQTSGPARLIGLPAGFRDSSYSLF